MALPERPADPIGAARTVPGSGSVEGDVIFLLIGMGRRLRGDVESRLADVNVSLRHVSALGHLSGNPGLSYSELARRAGITVQSMQATLSQLEELGAVTRSTPSGRGRKASLDVTAEGQLLLARSREVVAATGRQLLGSLAEDERVDTRTLLFGLFLAMGGPEQTTTILAADHQDA